MFQQDIEPFCRFCGLFLFVIRGCVLFNGGIKLSLSRQDIIVDPGVIGGSFERILSGIKKKVAKDEAYENENGELSEDEALCKCRLESEEVVVGHDIQGTYGRPHGSRIMCF